MALNSPKGHPYNPCTFLLIRDMQREIINPHEGIFCTGYSPPFVHVINQL